ncbi:MULTISPECIES: hypothetical protein [Enterococcus]|uniref:DNA-binding protein n=1 Tax=Enterococcus faecium TaxID=1352 RepID=A0AB73NQF8_ENTFC|nr:MULTISPECIES: hypothetical protein [Enterococcus]EGP5080267.1 hypothetical protein [Enterococcus faecium]EPI26429.1 hypothetical protein D352_00033 [Enterococcus faecium LA4B-2]MCK6147196.1 hypothetical protein [Enterococcus hirae]MCK6174976.1 hypothetical protein [Enterococcus hirae]MEB7441023.1 hypothetical protein [Enterococcus hirae]
MDTKNIAEIKQWMNNNLVTKQEALKITGQSAQGFQQSVRTNMIVPFYESKDGKGPAIVRLYLKSDIETYAKQLKAKKQKQQ